MNRTAVVMNPFPGLRPFHEEEEYLFFGRERQVDALVDKLAGTRFLAVVGTSGSGKSSLVNCGLRPALHRGLMTSAGSTWRMAQFRPGNDPLGAMARALATDGVLHSGYEGDVPLVEIIDTTLRMSKRGLLDVFVRALPPEHVNLLVVVDQFEELFRYERLSDSPQDVGYGVTEEATAFVNLLLDVHEQTDVPVYVVLTMRSDFLGDCAQFQGLPEAINAGQFLVPRMTRSERRAAIAGPVGVGDATIASILLTRLVNDVGDNPDQLSILQHALNRTWAQWESEGATGPLDLHHYEVIGTMAQALDQHAEQAYEVLDTERKRDICEKLFKALTDKGTDPRGIRRPTKVETLCSLTRGSQEEVVEVIDVFRDPSRSFLMPPSPESLDNQTIIDISHESLMRIWRRLQRWAEQEAESARTYHRLAQTAALYGEGRAGLWRDPDLQQAIDWRKQNTPTAEWAARYHSQEGSFDAAVDFLERSQSVAQAEAKRLRRRRNVVMFAAVSIAAVFGLLAGLAFWQTRKAQLATQRAEDATLLIAAREWLASDPTVAALLLAEVDDPNGFDGAVELMRKVAREPIAVTQFGWGFPVVSSSERPALFNPEGTKVAVSHQDGRARVWTADGLTELTVLEGSEPAGFSYDGEKVLTTSFGTGAWVQSTDGSGDAVLLEHDVYGAVSASFSPDGTRVLTISQGKAFVWNADASGQPVVLEETEIILQGSQASRIMVAAFSPDGRKVVTGGEGGIARIWLIDGQTESVLLRSLTQEEMTSMRCGSAISCDISSAEFSPDGTRVLTAGGGVGARVWTLDGSQLAELGGGYNSASFSLDGSRVVTASRSSARVMAADGSGEAIVLEHTEPSQDEHVHTARFSPDGGRVLTASGEGTVKIWRLGSSALPVILRSQSLDVQSAEFSSDGERVLTTSRGGTVRVWQVAGDALYLRRVSDDQLQEALRGATNICLHPQLLKQILGRSEDVAEREFMDCERDHGRHRHATDSRS